MTPICVPIFIKPAVDIEEAIEDAQDTLRPASAGMIELRCDVASIKQTVAALEFARVPAIVTIRPTWEGGLSQKSDAERLALWEAAIGEGADYVDVELQAWEKSRGIRETLTDLTDKHGTRLIVSHHSFDRRPPDLEERLRRLLKVKQASVLKIAWKAESIIDAVEALQLTQRFAQEHQRQLLALAMGEEGQISRLLARKFSAPFTFASAQRGRESAPGQPTAGELLTRYRWEKQAEDSAVFGVIGWPVGHSLSPHIHNAGFDAIDSGGVYVPLAIQPTYEAFAAAVDALRNCPHMNLRGLSVTIPHKENAMRYVREKGGAVDALSTHIGVINTITFAATGLHGFNSDYQGAMDALASAWDGNRQTLAGKRIAILGAGGAARAIVAGLAHANAAVTIFNRTLEKAQSLAAEFDGHTGQVSAAPWDTLAGACCDAYINCTPLGMHPKTSASPLDGLGSPNWNAETVVFDTVYNPSQTKFLKIARQKNARIVLGSEMFIRQAAIQFKHFTGHDAPLDVFREAMTRGLSD